MPVAPSFFTRIADLDWELRPQFASTRVFLKDYLVERPAIDRVAGRIAPTAADLAFERDKDPRNGLYPDTYLETLAVLRAIAEHAPSHGCMLMHGVAFECCSLGYVLCAPSGTGKSTHMGLWRTVFGDEIRVINGDKPFVRVSPEQGALVYGSPWMGKEGWGCNARVPLAGICILERAGSGSPCVRRVAPEQALSLVAASTYSPADPEARLNALDVLDGLLTQVPVYEARVAIDEYSARMLRVALVEGRLRAYDAAMVAYRDNRGSTAYV